MKEEDSIALAQDRLQVLVDHGQLAFFARKHRLIERTVRAAGNRERVPSWRLRTCLAVYFENFEPEGDEP